MSRRHSLLGPRIAAAVVAALITLIALVPPTRAGAADRFLTIGGGADPESNQVSLEKNVLYYQRVLEQLGLGDRPHHLYFADGDAPERDLQFLQHDDDAELRSLLATLMDDADAIDYHYRDHQLPRVSGPAEVRQIDGWFDREGQGLAAGDRLLIYFTGHGGKTSEKNTQNTRLHLWGDDDLTVKEFVERLDRVRPDVPVVLVMVQCYSGGFANVIFKDGDPRKGLDDHARAGFFATVHSRPAAGCTPDIDEANYQEYSSFFWAALLGESRVGEKVERPDYDRDGRTSFAEAHAYALLTSNSIDISIKTSDAFLRHFSKTAETNKDDSVTGLMPVDTSYRRLRAVAGPCERAVMDGLSRELELKSDDRTKAAKALASDISAERRRISGERRTLQRKYDGLRSSLAGHVKRRWPELGNAWHPGAARILAEESEAVLRHITSHRSFDDFERAAEKINALSTQSRDLERQWVKTQRLVHVLENVALAVNLPKLATPEVQDRYVKLLALENQTLGGKPR